MMNLLRHSKGSDEESKENRSLPKDMIYDIMLRLPGKSIFRFKCVSKTLNTSILSDPLFIHNYFTPKLQQKQLKKPTLLGFFYEVHNPQNPNHCVDQCYKDQEVSFVPMCHQGVPIASRSFKQGLGNFIASSNGLVLYGHHPKNYYVCNTVTNTWFALPPPIHTDDYHTEVPHNMYASDDTIKNLVGFYCQEENEQLSHHDVDAITNHIHQSYKVGRFFVKQASNNDWEMVVKIYSSDTGVWKESKLDDFGMPLYHVVAMSSYSISIRGVFFCSTTISTGMLIFAYVFNMASDGLDVLIEGPSSSHINGRAHGVIGESHLGFLQCAVGHDEGFEVYMLKQKLHSYFDKECYPFVYRSEWTLRHRVSTNDITNTVSPSKRGTFPVAFHAQNSHILYLRIGNQMICFDMQSGRLDFVPYDHSHGLICCSCCYLLEPFFYNLESWPLSPLPRQN